MTIATNPDRTQQQPSRSSPTVAMLLTVAIYIVESATAILGSQLGNSSTCSDVARSFSFRKEKEGNKPSANNKAMARSQRDRWAGHGLFSKAHFELLISVAFGRIGQLGRCISGSFPGPNEHGRQSGSIALVGMEIFDATLRNAGNT